MNRSNLKALGTINVVAGFAVVMLALMLVSALRKHGAQTAEIAQFTARRQAVLSLLNESAHYSQKNPAINPILVAAGMVQTQPQGTGSKPIQR